MTTNQNPSPQTHTWGEMKAEDCVLSIGSKRVCAHGTLGCVNHHAPVPKDDLQALADKLRYAADGMDMAMHGEEYGDTDFLETWRDKPHRVVFAATELLREAATALATEGKE